jgi:hypothetical protein
MKNLKPTDSQDSPAAAAPQAAGFFPWERLKSKRISYLTLPLLIMATITEFVILATGWRYQQVVCLPKGMGVTFFGIGPIGATILAVELLKLPLAIWTASRSGWQKGVMIACGLPLICLLTFQLVKDMAVYEMGVALAPAGQMLDEATKEEVIISQLNGRLGAIDQKKAERDTKLAALATKQAKAKAEIDDSLKRNADTRQDAISLTDYQKKELSDVDSRESTIIQQFNADTAQLTKDLADLRARREIEVGRAAKWNAEEARIDNAYKTKLADYTNKKTTYEKDKKDYDNANMLMREVMKEPVDPGVPPVREVNTILKSGELDSIEAQIASKVAELAAVDGKRRDRVAQVEGDAQQLREDFDKRSTTKREESDKKRDELLAAQAALVTQAQAEAKQINADYDASAGKVDDIRAELDEASKKAEGFYEARETAIKNTQVHRIATTVEIVRGLLMGQRPVSIKSTAKERGDLYTDQISMVRIWVYPILAFIVAFLPTLLVEIGFSTVFKPEEKRPAHRLGFLGQHLHWLYIRAGRQKILRAERLAGEVAGQIAARERALATAKTAAEQTLAATKTASEQALAAKNVELNAAQDAADAVAAGYEEKLQQVEEDYAQRAKLKEGEWVTKLAGMADSLNRTVVEKDSLRDLQKSEIERQIQMRQNAWSDRLTQMNQELDAQRTAAETERTAMMQAHHKKLMEMSEDCKNQVVQARRQASDTELASMEASARLTQELKDALRSRDEAEAELQQQADGFNLKLSQAKDDSARDMEKTTRQEKHRLERQQLEMAKTMRQREEEFERQLKQAQQEMSLGFEARLTQEQNRIEQESRRREGALERQIESRGQEVDARWKSEALHKEELFSAKMRQRDQEWQAKLDAARAEVEAETKEVLHRREAQAETAQREMEARLRKEMQQKEEAFQAKARQREQDLIAQVAAQAEARNMLARTQWETEADTKMWAAVEPLKSQLARIEKERDEALHTANEHTRQAQLLEKKLTEASTFLTTPWRNGKNGVGQS